MSFFQNSISFEKTPFIHIIIQRYELFALSASYIFIILLYEKGYTIDVSYE